MKKFKLKSTLNEFESKEIDEIYIGYFTEQGFKKCRFKTKRIDKNNNGIDNFWFPVYVKKWEWLKKGTEGLEHHLPKKQRLEIKR
jgi:hypothetical protein